MEPLLSICCTTFNHEKYVRETIEGFLIQQTSFPIEIIIHDDASTDGTAAIIKEYADKDHRIVTILQDENQFSQKIKPWRNHVFPKAKGKYIALCEGDDYWTDPLKLQKQVDFLEANNDFGICFHNVDVFDQDKNEIVRDAITKTVNEVTTIEDLAQGNYIHTPSVVLKNNFVLPEWFDQSPIGDWLLYMVTIGDSKIMKLSDAMAVYRVHSSSIWSKKSTDYKLKQTIKCYQLLLNNYNITDPTKKTLKKAIKRMKADIVEKESFFQKLKGMFNL